MHLARAHYLLIIVVTAAVLTALVLSTHIGHLIALMTLLVHAQLAEAFLKVAVILVTSRVVIVDHIDLWPRAEAHSVV